MIARNHDSITSEPARLRAALGEETAVSNALRITVRLVLGLALCSSPVLAGLCGVDNAPAASLLIPFFEVDLGRCGQPASERLDTAFSVGNTAPHPVLAGVTIWSNWGVPVTGFLTYLPGESTQRVTLGDFLCTGNLPQTGPAVSPEMAGTDPAVSFPLCNNSATPGFAPNYANPAAPPYFLEHIQQALTGQLSSLYDTYIGEDLGDDIARGYLTVDNVSECSLLVPSDPGYFISGGLGVANNDNVLVGEYSVRDNDNNFAYAQPAVGLEAANAVFNPGDMTFYGRYMASTAADEREPLPTTFASTFALAGAFDSSDQVIWRERGKTYPSNSPDFPDDLPLGKQNVTWFDTMTTPYPSFIPGVLPGDPGLDLVSYPLVTHAYPPGEVPYPVPFGWQYSNLQNVQVGGYFAGQSWIVTRSKSAGRYETSRAGIPLDSSCVDGGLSAKTISVSPAGGLAVDPPTLMLFWEDFEFGFSWSDAVGF